MKAPAQPNPYQVAQAQTQTNLDTANAQAKLNMTNQSTPYGTISYNTNSSSPSGYTATTQLSPEMQNLVSSDTANAQGSSNIEGNLLKNIATSSATPPDLGWSSTEANLNKLASNTLVPQWDQQQAHLEAQLNAQGIRPGNVAYNDAMRNFQQQRDDAMNSMYLQGHNTATGDILNQWNAPINALSALRSNSQVSQPGVGQTAATPQTAVAPTNIEGLISSNYNQRQAQYNAQLGGLFGLGGNIAGLATDPLGGTLAGKAFGVG